MKGDETKVAKALEEKIKEELNDKTFEKRRDELRRQGILITEIDRAYTSVEEALGSLAGKDLKLYYSTSQKVLLAVASIFEETGAYVERKINTRVKGQLHTKVYNKIVTAEEFSKEQYAICKKRVEQFEKKKDSIRERVSELRNDGQEYSTRLEQMSNEIEELEKDITEAETNSDTKTENVYREQKRSIETKREMYAFEGTQILSRHQQYQQQYEMLTGAINPLQEIASHVRIQYTALVDCRTQLELAKELEELELGNLGGNGESLGVLIGHGRRVTATSYVRFQEGVIQVKAATEEMLLGEQHKFQQPQNEENAYTLFKQMYQRTLQRT